MGIACAWHCEYRGNGELASSPFLEGPQMADSAGIDAPQAAEPAPIHAPDPGLTLTLTGPAGAAGQASGRRCNLSARTLRQVHEFIAANLTCEISVEDIAHAACLSPFHLSRAYHQATGQSLWQYVLQCRSGLARSMITAQPRTPLGEIAIFSGFDSYSQFIAIFRRAYGVTPGAYRRWLADTGQ
jgi:AraC-like DNA-binding protein